MTKPWNVVKTLIVANPVINVKYVKDETFYDIALYEGNLNLATCRINHTLELDDALDFETNYKSNANSFINSVESAAPPPFGNKKIKIGGVVKNLFKRVVGISQEVTVGENEFTWTQSDFNWVKFMGIEVIGGEIGDNCSMYVLDTAEGAITGVPNYVLNRFGYNVNVGKDFYKRIAEYDADISRGLQFKFVYNSISNKTVYFNFDMNEVK